MTSGKDSKKNSRDSVNRMKGVIMNKERLECIMSGLNRLYREIESLESHLERFEKYIEI